MAVRTFRVDDIDGSDIPEGTPVTFLTLNGKSVSLDLSPQNFAKLEKALEKYFAVGVVTTKTVKAQSNGSTDADHVAEIRAWALTDAEWSTKVKDRGRLPQALVDAFNAARPDKDTNE